MTMANTTFADLRIKVGEKFGIRKSHAKTSIMSYKASPLSSGRKTLFFGLSLKRGNTMRMNTGVSVGGERAKASNEEVAIVIQPMVAESDVHVVRNALSLNQTNFEAFIKSLSVETLTTMVESMTNQTRTGVVSCTDTNS